jgi:hypothetical protein
MEAWNIRWYIPPIIPDNFVIHVKVNGQTHQMGTLPLTPEFLQLLRDYENAGFSL